ncbi:MAG: metallophosphoesterase, partial [Clostridia bacterium]|nr:metallophosphoesterase [Clostridia bacterium]
MKKTLSMLIVVFMLIGMFSGAVLFTGSAAETATQAFSYTYVQLNGVQNWTASDVASLTTFGANFALSDKGLIGNATQSVELTVTNNLNRFCLASKTNSGFLAKNPFTFVDTTQGYQLSDFDGIAIAFSDADGNEIPLTQFQVRLMRGQDDWNSYWNYEANYYDMNEVYANGYYHLSFEDYGQLGGTTINQISVLSALFYKSGIRAGDKAYISDICAYTKSGTAEPPEPPVGPEYEYLQLDGVQKWTQAHLAQTSANNGHLNNVMATYYLSDQQLAGNATQSIKAVKSQANGFNCLVNKAYDTNDIACPSPWIPSDGVSKLSDYDGVMIAVKDANGNRPSTTQVRLRILINPGSYGWGTFYQSTNHFEYVDGYYKFPFKYFDNSASLMEEVDGAKGISFLLDDNGVTEYYYSDFLAYREKRNIDYSALAAALESLEGTQAALDNPDIIAAAQAVLNDPNATQEMINEQVSILKQLLRENLPKVNFDENNIVLTFGAISDIHIDGTIGSSSTNKYLNAAQKLLKYSGGRIDAVTVAGDFSNSSYNDSIPQAFKSINDQVFGENAIKAFFVTGNHDAQGSDYASLNSFYQQLACYTSEDEAGSQHNRGNRHMVINGYHFLAVNMMDYWNSQEARFDPQDLEWLDRELAVARADAPGKQIFVYMHAQVFGTTYGSSLYTGSWWGSKSVYDHLKDYPEVVTFAGHIHFPLEDERTIYQRDFTSLDTGSVQYMAIDNGYLESGSKTTIDPDSWGVSSGLMVQIDANGNMKVTRIDFGRDAIIKQPFYVPAPDIENETHLMYYDDYRFNEANEAPVFPKDAAVSAAINGKNLEVNFTAANDDDMVHRYLFEIVGIPSGSKTTVKSFSEFYNYPQVRDMPKSYRRLIPYTLTTGDKGFEISVYAVDSGGKSSEPIVYNSIIGEPTITPPPGPNLINIYFISGEPRVSGLNNISLTTRGETVKYKTKYGFSGANESRVTAFAPSSAYTLTAKKFTAEAAFAVGSVGTEQYLLSCGKDNKGFGLYQTADGRIALTMNTASDAYTVQSSTVVAPGEFHSAIVNFQSGKLTLYVDGTAEDEVTVTGNAVYNTNVGHTVGARITGGTNYGDFYDGVIYQAGVGSNPYTAETAGQRAMDYTNGWNYKYVQSLYDEYESTKEALALNPDASEAARRIIENYALELEAALNAVAVTEAYINTVSRSDEVVANLADFNVALELPEIAAPVVTGVADGEVYTEPVTITWDEATNAELDHEPFENGSVVKKPGEHKLFVQNKYASVAIYFTIEGDEEPEVSIADGAEFGIPGEPVSATWTPAEATATLNGEEYLAGTVITETGEYVLVVTNGTKSVTVNFTIVDNYMVPEVSVADGTEFKLSDFGEGPLVITWTPEEATATLNGEEYTHTHIEEPGEYVLVVTNGTKSVTINFTIVDDTPVPTLSIEDGAQFDLYTAADPIAVTWTPEGATGTLNGEEYLAGTAITEVGEYTLTVVNGSKEVTVHFTVVDTTPQVKRGDMDGDGEITVADALKALRIAAKLAEETPEALAVGDV